MNKIQVIDGFKYKTDERNAEIFNTIKWNSKIFDKIFILCENTDYFEHFKILESDVIQVINLNEDGFISMQRMFNFVNENSNSEDLKFLSNIDGIYTEQFHELTIEDDCIYTFNNRSLRNPKYYNGFGHSSYIREEGDGLDMFNKLGILDPTWFMKDQELDGGNYWRKGVCGWAWRTVKNLNTDHEMCYQCYPQAEQCMMSVFRNSGYVLKNAGMKFPTYHNHGSNEKTENNKFGMDYHGTIDESI